jgi:thioredoxin 1
MRAINFSSAADKRKIRAFNNNNYHISWSLAALVLAILATIPKTTLAFQLSTLQPTTITTFRHDRCARPHELSHRSIFTRLHSSTNTSIGKSGGRVIDSLLSFEKQVLLKNSDDSDGSDEETSTDDNNIVMAFYTAPWCGPCRLSNPVVKEINQLFKNTGQLDVVEICTDDLPEVPEMAGVVSIPTIQLYHKGQLQETIVGCVAKNVLEKAIRKLIDEISPLPIE